MTKQDILLDRKDRPNCGDYTDSEIYAAMEEYAKSEVITFTEWHSKGWIRVNGNWLNIGVPIEQQVTLNTIDLYNIYIQSKEPH